MCVLATDLSLGKRFRDRDRFPAPVRLLLAGELVIALGVGLTQPYAVVLLHEVHGLSLAVATGIWGLGPVATILGNAVAGPLIDRRGGRFVMVVGQLLVIAGGLLLAYGPGIPSAAAGIVIGGLGWSFSLPALGTRLAILAAEEIRSRVFTIQYVFFNLGMAIGAALGGLVFVQVSLDTPAGRSVVPLLWVAMAGACVVTIALAWLAGHQASPGETDDAVQRGGYRRALRDTTLLRLIGAAALLSTVGYGVNNAAPAVLALAADDPAALSFASVANCLAIVVGSPFALRLTARVTARARLLWTAGFWALAWAICVPTALDAGPGARVVLTASALLVGAGELVLAGALPTLINAMAPDELRGRYNALSRLSLTLGMAAGPLLVSAATAGGSFVLALYAAIALTGLASILLPRLAGEPEPQPAEVTGEPGSGSRPAGVADDR